MQVFEHIEALNYHMFNGDPYKLHIESAQSIFMQFRIEKKQKEGIVKLSAKKAKHSDRAVPYAAFCTLLAVHSHPEGYKGNWDWSSTITYCLFAYIVLQGALSYWVEKWTTGH